MKKPLIKDYFSKQFVLFVVLSGISAVFNMLARILFSLFTPYAMAIVISFFVGMAIAFTLNRKFAFRASNTPVRKQILGFVIVNVIGLAQTLTVSLALHYWLFPLIGYGFYSAESAHFIGLGTTAFTSFFGHKYFTFK